MFELIQRAKCESIETFHKFSQQGNKGITYAKYSEDAAHRSLEKFLLHFPGGQPNIGQGNWTNVSITMCPRRGVKPMPRDSPLQLGLNTEDVEKPNNPLLFLLHLILGAMAGVYYVLVTSATLVPFVAPNLRAKQILKGINGSNVYVTPYDLFAFQNAHMFLNCVTTHFDFLVCAEIGNYIAKNDAIKQFHNLMLLSMLNEFHDSELCYVARVKMKYIIFLSVELELSKHSTN